MFMTKYEKQIYAILRIVAGFFVFMAWFTEIV
jgi:hypothetical protein